MKTKRENNSTSKLDKSDDAPELTDEWFERADLFHGDKLIRRGRPLGSGTKVLVSLRLDKETVAALDRKSVV